MQEVSSDSKRVIGIYKITNPEGKVYIGQSTNIDSRWKTYEHFRDEQGQRKLYKSIGTYGWINHHKEVLEECRADQLDERERYWQLYYKAKEEGLNGNTKGGSIKKKKVRLRKEKKVKIDKYDQLTYIIATPWHKPKKVLYLYKSINEAGHGIKRDPTQVLRILNKNKPFPYTHLNFLCTLRYITEEEYKTIQETLQAFKGSKGLEKEGVGK
jgi:hypothetical protein